MPDFPINIVGYLRLWDRKTGDARGYIAADAVQNVMTVPTKGRPNEYLCRVNWTWAPGETGNVWLNSDNAAFQSRQMGLSYANVADWGIPSPGGFRNPLRFHFDGDKTIELADSRGRFLSMPTYSDRTLYWSGGPDDPTILCAELEPG
jgi:hypothetical protein